MTFAIAGTSGHTGKIIAESLLAQGKRVRVIARDPSRARGWQEKGAEVAIADLADAAAMGKALAGASSAYLLIPPNFATPNFRAYQDAMAKALAGAVAKNRTAHVVLLSSVGAQHATGTGPIAGLHVFEQLLDAVPGTVVSKLRAAYFIENLGASLAAVRDGGVLPSFFPASFAFPMTNTRDIGKLATQLLLEAPKASEVVELGTEHSMNDLARVFTRLLERDVRVEEAPLAAVVPTFTSFGMTEDMASLYAEMIAGVRTHHVAFEGHRRVQNSEPLERTLAHLLG